MGDISVLRLISQLCDLHLGQSKRVHRVQPRVSHEEAKKKLKHCALNTLFSYLWDVGRNKTSLDNRVPREAEGLLLQVRKLRHKRRFEDADKLESLFQKLKGKQEDAKQVLKLLVALKGTGSSGEVETCGQDAFHLEALSRIKPAKTLPYDPLNYGDLLCSSGNTVFYTHYPANLFDQPFRNLTNADEQHVFLVCNQEPGQGISADCMFTSQFLLDDAYEKHAQISVFGGMVQGAGKGVDFILDFPELSAEPDVRIPEFKCTKSVSSSQLSEESGVGSGSQSMSSSVITLTDQSIIDDNVWEKALSESRSQHYTWEWIGYQPGPTEKPFLTEAGPEVLHVLLGLRQRVTSVLSRDTSAPALVSISTQTLVKHVLLMLVGVPSVSFPVNKDNLSFSVAEGLYISGTSPEALGDFLSEFTACGTFYLRLSQFAQPPVLDSFYTGGLVFQAFVSSIRKILHRFHAAILDIPFELHLLQLRIYLCKAMKQLRYMARLCHCHDKPPPPKPPGNFPTGMQLLSYLYVETQASLCTDHYTMLLSVLQRACAPLMLFVHDWVFQGLFRDVYEEFMIKLDHGYLEARDESYWSCAFTLKVQSSKAVPEFLQDSLQDIVTCGKSINLLRLCDHQHYLCSVSESETPGLSITFSQSELRVTQSICQMYVAQMREIGRQVIADRKTFMDRIEREKQELLQRARQVADEELARLQGAIDERKKKDDLKKRKEFDRLKEQMVADLQKRAGEAEKEKAEDREFVARINREEEALTEQEIELEKKAKEDLIAYYTELGEEAVHRERKALWRVQRARLDAVRADFLIADEERWKREMQEHIEAKMILDSVPSTDIPSWVEASKERETTLQISDKEEITLPLWAVRELPENEMLNLDEETGPRMPRWAQREMDSEVLEVKDDAEDSQDEDNEEETEEKSENQELSGEGEKSGRQFHAIQLGGAALGKPHLHMTDWTHTSSETEEVSILPHIQSVDGKHISNETDSVLERKSTIQTHTDRNAFIETTEATQPVSVKFSDTMHATKESDLNPETEKRHLKFAGTQVNEESSQEREVIPKRQRSENSLHATSETQPIDWIIKKPSLFGHVSQLCGFEYVMQAPRLRRQAEQTANRESDIKDFAIKPKIRMSKHMSATTENADVSGSGLPRSHIRILSERNASIESQPIDENAVAIARFRQRNIKGHASDSTIQRLLYGNVITHGHQLIPVQEGGPLPRLEITPGPTYDLEKYQTEFSQLGDEPVADLMSSKMVLDLAGVLVDTSYVNEEEVETHKYMPLSVLLAQSMMAPLRAQAQLVNDAVISYFTSELRIDNHFVALRRYLLMADGDFVEILANILLEKLSTNPLPQEIFNPMFLNGALNKAIRSSIHSDDSCTKNLNFALKYMPNVLSPNDPKSLECLDLCYHVKWPLNIVLTESCLAKYRCVFTFLMQLKHVVWMLKDIWHRLKRDALITKAGKTAQFRKLQLYRQEMEHFVKMMQGYIANQVIHVSWQEFQTSLAQPIAGLDQLHFLHEHYVDQTIARCLLDKKAEKVMKIIQDIFHLILKFRSQLVSGSWTSSEDSNNSTLTHSSFNALTGVYNSFHLYSCFLFKVVNRLAMKGYQRHLQELLLQLNFNEFYTESG